MKYRINETKLKNGLRIFHVAVPSDDVAIIIRFNGGPLYETGSISGISHFIEHLLALGTAKRPTNHIIESELDQLGGNNDLYTDSTNVTLPLRVLPEDLDHAFELMSDILFHSLMRERDIRSERKVILDEMRMYADDGKDCMWVAYYKTLFRGTSLAFPILGTKKTLQSLTPRSIRLFYKKVINPQNATLFFIGPVPFRKAVTKMQKHFGHIPKRKNPKLTFKRMPPNKPRLKIQKKAFEDAFLATGLIVANTLHKDSYPLMIVASALNRNIYEELRIKNPVGGYEAGADYIGNRFEGHINVTTTCDPSKYALVRKLIRKAFTDFSKGIISDKQIKNAITLSKKNFLLRSSSCMDKAKTLVDFWAEGDIYEVNEYLKMLDRLTPNQVRAAAKKYIDPEKLTEVVVGNVKKK